MIGISPNCYVDYIKQSISIKSNKAGVQNDNETIQSNEIFSSVTFDTSLDSVDYNSQNNQLSAEQQSVPNRWTSVQLYKIDQGTLEGYTVNQDAIARVKEQLLSEGIDPDNRMPTHEITEEQIEWLGSRYDFDFLNACSFTHEEFGNFMLDLAYLNVFSLDEIENMYGVMPFNSNHSGYLYKLDTGDGISGYSNPFHLGVTMIDDDDELLAQLIMEYLKAKNVGLSDEEYERQSEEFAVQRKERLTVIDDFFARVCGNNINVMQQIQSVEDVSDKLKEDFGFLL